MQSPHHQETRGQAAWAKPRLRAPLRGAMDATGTDEVGWARDRRVDIIPGDGASVARRYAA